MKRNKESKSEVKVCYGKQDVNISMEFKEDCNKCRLREKCLDETLRSIGETYKARYCDDC